MDTWKKYLFVGGFLKFLVFGGFKSCAVQYFSVGNEAVTVSS